LAKTEAWQQALETVVACIAPFAPHMADELWLQLGHHLSVQKDTWPKWEEKFLAQDTITVAVQVNGKLRGEIRVAPDVTEVEAIATAQANDKVKAHIADKQVVNSIYVPGKIVNLVVK
jgi:leucyl-tRNA synthetase